MQTKILGFTGKKQSGKDKNGDWLVGNATELFGDGFAVSKYALANRLKQFCMDYLNVPYESMYGSEEQKNMLIEHILWEEMPHYGALCAQWSIDCMHTREYFIAPKGPMTGRQIMQQVGTEWFRKIRPNIWTDFLLDDIRMDNCDLAIVCDVRFPNEVEAIQAAGGKVVRLLRNQNSTDIHISETALDKENFEWSKFDLILPNDRLGIHMTHQYIAQWLQEIGWR